MNEESVKIRDYRMGDAGAVIRVMREVFIDEYGWTKIFLRDAVRTLRKMLMTMIPVREIFLVAESEGDLCGVMFLKVGEEEAAFIRWLAVKRNYRGRGIGRTLLKKALEFSREAGYERVKLITVGVLNEAMELYTHAGFVEVDQKKVILWDMEIDVHYMEVRL